MDPYVCLMKIGPNNQLPGSFIDHLEDLVTKEKGSIQTTYGTLGRYDFVAVLDLPSPVAAAQISTTLKAWGVATETLTAISASVSDEQLQRAFSSPIRAEAGAAR